MRASQSMARVNPQTYNSIKGLTDDRNTVVVIFSGSGKVTSGKLMSRVGESRIVNEELLNGLPNE